MKLDKPFPGILWEGFLQLLFPRKCFLCGRITPHGEWLCGDCRPPVLPCAEACRGCGKPVEHCVCYLLNPAFDGADAAFLYQDGVRQGIWRFKYSGRTYYAPYLGEAMAARLRECFGGSLPFDAVCYVPMHPRKRRARGYCQSRLLAEKLAELLAVPLVEGAVRHTGNKRPQASQKGMDARMENARHSFAAGDGESVRGLRLLLVDDVITTGATASCCAALLKEQGAQSVYLIAAASVPR